MNRAVLFVGLAACWSTTKQPDSKPVAKTEPKVETTKSEPAKAEPVVKAEPAKPKAPPFVLPKRVADGLAKEPLAGNVLVPGVIALYPTDATARSGAALSTKGGNRRGTPMAMKVVKDHGDVVEISTSRTDDCAGDYEQPYELNVFVKREHLVVRTKVDITKAFPDGTAVAIDRGAPVSFAEGLGWSTHAFTETKVLPNVDQLTYAVPAKLAPAELPKQTADRLVCERSNRTPMTHAEWQAAKRAEREAELRAKQEARRAEMERKRAEMERRRPEIEREQKARAERERKECERKERAREAAAKAKAKKQPKQHGPKTARQDALDQAMDAGILGKMSTCAMASMFSVGGLGDLGDYDSGFSDLSTGMGMGGYDAYSYAPFCGVYEPQDEYDFSDYGMTKKPKVKAAPPTVNGNVVSWPSYYDRARNDHVVKQGTYYLADVHHTCGRVRMAVEAAGVASTGGGVGIGGGGQVKVWVPKPGPVTWPDGSPAGKYNGGKRYQDVVEKDDRICVHVPNIAELVCHPKRTTTTEMAYRSSFD